MVEEFNLASDSVILLLRQTVGRSALIILLRVVTVTQILVSHTNHWFKSICIIKHCLGPVNGGWSGWSPWTECTKTCGTGAKTRERTCNNPKPDPDGRDCKGDKFDIRECNTESCVSEPGTNWELG